MSESNTKSDNLHPLQRLIILHLAKSEPQTINQTTSEIAKSYKPTHTAFKSLEKKKLIGTAYSKPYRGQEYKCYWLTDIGMIMALMEGANSEKLLAQAKKVYPEDKNIHVFLEIAPSFHPEVVKMAYSSVKGKGKIGVAEVILLFLSQPAIAMDAEPANKVTAVLKKYPDEYRKLKTAVEEMINRLSQLIAE